MLLSLLRSQNRCLEKLIALSEELLSESSDPQPPRLDRFDRERGSALRAFDLLERKIAEIASVPPELIAAVRSQIDRRRQLLDSSRDVDSRVMEMIRQCQARLEKELASSRKNRELLGKFKSTRAVSPGAELDRSL